MFATLHRSLHVVVLVDDVVLVNDVVLVLEKKIAPRHDREAINATQS